MVLCRTAHQESGGRLLLPMGVLVVQTLRKRCGVSCGELLQAQEAGAGWEVEEQIHGTNRTGTYCEKSNHFCSPA